MKVIGPLVHGVLDYLTVVLFAIAPSVVGFSGKQAIICYALAIIHLLLTLVTRFPLGALKIVGLPIHGGIEAIVSLLLIALPWIAGFSNGILSRNFYVCIGLLIGLIWLLTDYRNLRGRAAVTPSVSSR